MDRLGDLTENLLDPSQAEADILTVRAALGSARPPLPPQEISPEMVEAAMTAWSERKSSAGVLLGSPSQIMRASLEAALRVRGEPSREPTLEDRFSLEDSLRSGYLFGNYDEPLDDYGKRIVRAILVRLSSPEAPR